MSDNFKNIRWRQRFSNLKNSFEVLERAIKIENPSEVEKGGIIQFYEVSLELAWKTLKDFLESEGFIVKSPREAIKTAFQYGILEKGELWLEALNDRNLTTHLYDEAEANKVIDKIKNNYFHLLKSLIEYFNEKLQ